MLQPPQPLLTKHVRIHTLLSVGKCVFDGKLGQEGWNAAGLLLVPINLASGRFFYCLSARMSLPFHLSKPFISDQGLDHTVAACRALRRHLQSSSPCSFSASTRSLPWCQWALLQQGGYVCMHVCMHAWHASAASSLLCATANTLSKESRSLGAVGHILGARNGGVFQVSR